MSQSWWSNKKWVHDSSKTFFKFDSKKPLQTNCDKCAFVTWKGKLFPMWNNYDDAYLFWREQHWKAWFLFSCKPSDLGLKLWFLQTITFLTNCYCCTPIIPGLFGAWICFVSNKLQRWLNFREIFLMKSIPPRRCSL